jgi:hypothetical protein
MQVFDTILFFAYISFKYFKATAFSSSIWPTNPQSLNYKFWNLVLPIFWTSSFYLEVYCGKQRKVPYLVSILSSEIVSRLIKSQTASPN